MHIALGSPIFNINSCCWDIDGYCDKTRRGTFAKVKMAIYLGTPSTLNYWSNLLKNSSFKWAHWHASLSEARFSDIHGGCWEIDNCSKIAPGKVASKHIQIPGECLNAWIKCLNEIQGKMSADRNATTPRRHTTWRCPGLVGNRYFSPLSLVHFLSSLISHWCFSANQSWSLKLPLRG